MTDYSKDGISAVLSQHFEDGEHPISYYLLGKEFTILTDHLALQWLNKHKGDNAFLLKWSLALQEYYPFEIKWRPGQKHGAADTLSRFPYRLKTKC
jgi:glutathione S-transferase